MPFAGGEFRVLFAVSFVGFLVLTAIGQADPEDEEAASCHAPEGRCVGAGLLVVSPSQGLSCGGVEGGVIVVFLVGLLRVVVLGGGL